jgi:hypothetical protein
VKAASVHLEPDTHFFVEILGGRTYNRTLSKFELQLAESLTRTRIEVSLNITELQKQV